MISLLKAMLGMGGESIGPREAVQRMNAGAVLVDVREPHEFDAGHAPQAKTLPLGRISAQGAVAIDALHLPLDVARERLGIRDARFVDTSAETAIYLEQV